jgi:hypothetical protein
MSVHFYQSPDCCPDITSPLRNDSTNPWFHPAFGISNLNPASTHLPFTGYSSAEELFPNSDLCDEDLSVDNLP